MKRTKDARRVGGEFFAGMGAGGKIAITDTMKPTAKLKAALKALEAEGAIQSERIEGATIYRPLAVFDEDRRWLMDTMPETANRPALFEPEGE